MKMIDDETIDYHSHVGWCTANLPANMQCHCCAELFDIGDTVLLEAYTLDGLQYNYYCQSCGDKRLNMYAAYYTGLIKNVTSTRDIALIAELKIIIKEKNAIIEGFTKQKDLKNV